MNSAITVALWAVVAYLVGSIPFGLLIARWVHGVDLRSVGSGNIGATNVARTLGRKSGLACLLLDFFKGALPPALLPRLGEMPAGWFDPTVVACGTAAILGHVFPIWLGFRGGKGVATGAGVAMILSWPAGLAALAVFAVVFAIKRTVSLASVTASVAYALAVLATIDDFADKSRWPLIAFAVAIPTLIVVRHRENIARLLRGEEESFRDNSTAPRKPDDTSSGKTQSTT